MAGGGGCEEGGYNLYLRGFKYLFIMRKEK